MVRIYKEKEIETLRQSGKILFLIIKELKRQVRPGLTTKYLDKVANDLVLSYGGQASFKGFENYPTGLCTSINEEIVHAVPNNRQLKQGDILSLDYGVRYKGYCTDMAITIPVGKTNNQIKKLIQITKKALNAGIKNAKPGNHIGDISWSIQNKIEKNNFSVIKQLIGHGVGKDVHEEPQIPNFGSPGQGIELKKGMVFALEPMASIGDWQIEQTEDGFGYRTKDRSLSAHFEHTILITSKGSEILTKP